MAHRTQHLTENGIAVGIDLASDAHVVVVCTARGQRLTRFTIPHSRKGIAELLRRTRPAALGHPGASVTYAFEATGHFWEAVAYALQQAGATYRLVNPLATHRLREARQLDRDKRDVTDAEQIAEMLRTGLITKTQLDPVPYVELRRLWGEFDRLRSERARLKTVVRHQLYGLFPEVVRNWKDIFAPGALALLRLGLTPAQMARVSAAELFEQVQAHRRGRRVWRFKIVQAWEKAAATVASPYGAEAMAEEARRLVARADLLEEQMEVLAAKIQQHLATIEEAQFLETLPGIGWVTVAGLIAEIGPIDKYRHGRQLVKLAGINPSRRESGRMAGKTTMTRRGRSGLRAIVYMATLASLQHNPRIKGHYERLIQRQDRPLPKMQALGACMTKFLMYAFALMHKRVAFDVNHVWEVERRAA
jgi:transposase